MTRIVIILIVLCASSWQASAQPFLRSLFPKSAVSLQYAGSIGVLSFGYYRMTENRKLEFGLIYGNVPQTFGGPLHAFTMKAIYTPFLVNVSPRISWNPVQAALFITDWSGETLHTSWSGRYPKGYYWWQSSLRKYVGLSTQFSWHFKEKKAGRLSFYVEANTNDLYMYDYLPNTESQSFYDMVYYGFGFKLYFN